MISDCDTGPPWCNASMVYDEHTELFGASTAAADPVKYIQCVERLIGVYQREMHSSIPLVVNTMGWKQG